jgi:tetratricopeptide (TPR) repeat protein
MKKLVFASMMALASVSFVSSPMLRAQDSITIKDPAEYNTYQMAIALSDPKAKASALESFLTAYPQSVVKNDVLDRLLNTYYNAAPQGTGDPDKALSAASHLLQADPNNLEAILYSVIIKKGQCGKTQDVQTCDDAAAFARKGLLVPKPTAVADADWKSQTGLAYPNFHSAIAFDFAAAHKDFKGAIDEYTQELMLYSDDQSKTNGLQDTLLLAQAYSQPGPAKDLVKAVWFYARVWNFVPAGYKPKIETQLKYYYNKFHGNLDGLDDVKAKSALTTFPSDFVIKPAETPAEKIHDLILATPDLRVLNLGDKETVLAIGTKEDADKLWSVLKNEPTPVPGTVISAPASAIKVVVTQGVKASDFIVNLATPVDFASFKAPDATDLKSQQEFILANGVKDDTAKLSAIFDDLKTPIKKIVIEPVATSINVAVTADAKASKTADFIVNLKTPVGGKEAPAAGFVYGISSKGEAELDGTYDTYKQIPATDTTSQSALIVLRDGTLVEKKTPAAAAHAKPAAAHHAVKH